MSVSLSLHIRMKMNGANHTACVNSSACVDLLAKVANNVDVMIMVVFRHAKGSIVKAMVRS